MKINRLHQAYDFPGFKALATVREHPEAPSAFVVTLRRSRKKKTEMSCVRFPQNFLVRPKAEDGQGFQLWGPAGVSRL